ncbi:short chain dehydrogenase [Pseudomonas sp. NFACC43]|nr:short chain dehydrogenase [Pseudomonas sp. NFACC43]SFX14162.1 short chain dehydrogenase [Pseudomonas sp. NFACC47-1]
MNNVSQAPLILITGGGRGVGAATARLAAARGYDVAISYVANQASALAVVADVQALGRRALAVRADSADPGQVADLFTAIDRSFGRLDVLVNNAGVLSVQSRLEDLGFERMQRIFAVNSIGPMLCAQQAVKRMAYRHNGAGGVMINVSSASARLGSPQRICRLRGIQGSPGNLHHRVGQGGRPGRHTRQRHPPRAHLHRNARQRRRAGTCRSRQGHDSHGPRWPAGGSGAGHPVVGQRGGIVRYRYVPGCDRGEMSG